MAIGSVFHYGIALISSMILSRYFCKSDYGTYKQVIYVYHTLLTIFTLGLPRAYSYFLPRVPESQAKDLISRLTRLFLYLGLLFSLVLFVFSPAIAIVLKNPDLKDAIRLFAIVPTLLLPTLGLDGILATYKKARFLAVYKAITSLIVLLCVSLPVMFFHLGYMDAIKGFIIGSALQCVIALFLKNQPVRSFKREKSSVSLGDVLSFSLPLLSASIWGIIITSTDQFYISRFFGTEVFAEFSNGSIELPFLSMIVGACAVVLSPVFSKMSHEHVDFHTIVYPLWKSVYEKTAMIIYPILVYCFVFSIPIMEVLYGIQYSNSGIYFRIKMIVNFLNLIAFAPLLINSGKVRFYANVHAVTAVVLIIFDYLAILIFNSPYAVACASALCNIGKIIIMLIAVSNMFKVSFVDLFPFKKLLIIVVPSLCFLFGLYYSAKCLFHIDGLGLIILSLIVFSIFYCLLCRIANLNYMPIFKPLFQVFKDQ